MINLKIRITMMVLQIIAIIAILATLIAYAIAEPVSEPIAGDKLTFQSISTRDVEVALAQIGWEGATAESNEMDALPSLDRQGLLLICIALLPAAGTKAKRLIKDLRSELARFEKIRKAHDKICHGWTKTIPGIKSGHIALASGEQWSADADGICRILCRTGDKELDKIIAAQPFMTVTANRSAIILANAAWKDSTCETILIGGAPRGAAIALADTFGLRLI